MADAMSATTGAGADAATNAPAHAGVAAPATSDADASAAAAAAAASASASAAAAADLSAPDAILEPSVLSSLSSYMSATGGGARAAKRVVRMLSEGYKGRGDMLRLLGAWTLQAGGEASPAAMEAAMQRRVARAVASRFDQTVADRVLSQSQVQPAWLDSIVAAPEWEGPLLALAEKAPSSLFLRLCVSLMSEHRREHAHEHHGTGGGDGGHAVEGEAGAGSGAALRGSSSSPAAGGASLGSKAGGSGGSGGGGSGLLTTSLNAPIRAGALAHVEQFHTALDALLHALLDKAVERAAARNTKRKRAGTAATAAASSAHDAQLVKSEAQAQAHAAPPSDFVARVRSLELESLVADFLRLSAQSEWTYLYAQRLLRSAGVSAPRSCAYVLRRLSQDLSEQAAHPPAAPASLLHSSAGMALAAAAAASAATAPPHNTSVYPLDMLLSGVRAEWSDVGQVLLVLGRTGSLAALDIGKLYARYAATVAEPPPAALLRNRALIRILIEALFASNSPLLAAALEGDFPGGDGGGGGSGGRVSDRYKYAYLLAYACSVSDGRVGCVQLQRRLAEVEAAEAAAAAAASPAATAAAALHSSSSSSSSSSLDKSALDSTLSALLRFHDLAANKTWGVRPYTLLRCIHSNLSSSGDGGSGSGGGGGGPRPLLPAVCVYWMSTQLCSDSFFDTTYHSTVTPYFLNLLGETANRHPLLRAQVFDLVARCFDLAPASVDGFVLIQLRKLLLNLLLHLLHCGHNLGDILGLVLREIPRGMDHSLIRHFVVLLLHSTGPPYSRPFLAQVLRVLALPQTYKALQSQLQAGAELKRMMAAEMSAAAAASPANSAVAHFLAQAHVAPNTPAAKRLLAAAEKHGHLPAGSSLAPEAALSAEDEAADAASAEAEGEGAAPSVKKEEGEEEEEEEDADGEPASKKTKLEPGSTPSSIVLIPGTKSARREERERLRRAVADAEQRRRAEALKRLLHTAHQPREPRPLAQLMHGPDVRDGSETAVLDFCLLLHAEPDLIRLSPPAGGLQLDAQGAVVADYYCGPPDAAATAAAAAAAQLAVVPVDEHTMQQYMHTLKQYLDTQEKMP